LIFAGTIQWLILRYFGYSLLTMTPYGGQPWLCNMGRSFMACDPSQVAAGTLGEDCIGPGGTIYSGADLFSDFGTWSTRMYVRDSLLSIFGGPGGNQTIVDRIKTQIDPGEYGLEDEVVRYLALLLLAIQIQAEFRAIVNTLVVISWMPCNSTPWLRMGKEDGGADDVKFIHGGMPWYWKIVSYLITFFRLMILWNVGVLGTRFLLNTAAIQDLIFNSLALTFIFGLDEIIQSAWSTKEPSIMMGKLEPIETDRHHWFTRFNDCLHNYIPVPFEMILAIIVMIAWVSYIFAQSCMPGLAGGLVSTVVNAVEYGSYSILAPWSWVFTTTPQWCPPATLVNPEQIAGKGC
jgi:hypothetical protein